MHVEAISETVEAVEALQKAGADLQLLLRDSETEIGQAASGFADLARHTDAILQLTGAIVGRVEEASAHSVLPKVQALGDAARHFIQERLEATVRILETVTSEVKLLERLAQLTRGQKSIARETQTLSVLTNIEVARLGQLGAGFQYLAHQLDEFSQSVTKDTRELSNHTDERKVSIEETRRKLAGGLPRIRLEFTRIEEALGIALTAVERSQGQLSQAPAQFQGCVGEIASQISGVNSAVQANDITRQQLEHVMQALEWTAEKISLAEEPGEEQNAGLIGCGLVIQCYQLRSIRQTVGNWVAQMGRCLDGILRISSSDLVEIGPVVLEQERELSAQLARIEQLEQECLGENEEVQSTLTGLSSLMDLVGEHLERSRTVRDRMQLLTFNSIVEASHLGTQADAILEISQSIKRISAAWSDLTERSAEAKEEILSLVEQAKTGMKAFSEESNEELCRAQAETGTGLEHLRASAQFASSQSAEVETATRRLQERIEQISATGDRLNLCFAQLGRVLEAMERVSQQWNLEHPHAGRLSDRKECEERFAANYTTEMERKVMRAALDGRPLPEHEENLAGNCVELF